jgi:hypothetical protein
MTDFVLPSTFGLANVDISGYTLSGDDPGFITDEQCCIIKNLVDQMDASETVHIRSPLSGTGKTEKFIIDHCSVLPNIVTTDFFNNTLLNCDDFFTLVGNNAKVFKNALPVPTPVVGDDDSYTSLVIPDNPNRKSSTDATIDLTTSPVARSSAQLAGLTLNDDYNCAGIVNSAGTSYGTDSDSFNAELVLYYPNPITLGPAEWDQNAILTLICSSFNDLPVNGTLVVFNAMLGKVNTPIWTCLNAQTSVGRTYDISWIAHAPHDTGNEGPHDTVIVKRLS